MARQKRKAAGGTPEQTAPIVISSDKPEAEVIELSSDSESNYDEYLNGDEGGNQHDKAEIVAVATTGTPGETEDALEAELPVETASESPSTKKQRLPMRVKDTESPNGHRRVQIEIPVAAQSVVRKTSGQPTESRKAAEVATPATNKRSHVHFDGTSPEQFYTPLEVPSKNPLEATEDKRKQVADEASNLDSDDDAPPEAVSTSVAAAQTLKATQIAVKAAELQAAAQKRKRQQRDTLFKSQAETRKRARKDSEDVESSAEGQSEKDTKAEKTVGASASRQEKVNTRSLLPAEFLESDSEEESGRDPAASRRPKKVKFNTAERNLAKQGRPPQDRRVGTTVYRVLTDPGDGRLAPKSGKHSKHLKKELLARKRIAQRQTGGFFVKR